MSANDIVTLEPITDPATGEIMYAAVPGAIGTGRLVAAGDSVETYTPTPTPGGEMANHTEPVDWNRIERAQDAGRTMQIVDGELVPAGHKPAQLGQSITLTDDRFAGDPQFDWERAERGQDAGHTMQIIDGELVPAGHKPAQPGQSITLTDDRFAATPSESAEVMRLVRSGVASKLISDLRPTSEMRSYFAQDPGGWYLRTKPTPSSGDVLHTVIKRKAATGLYHAHLWRFMQNDRGELKSVDLNRWVGSHAALSAHNVHLYPGSGGDAAILCLSQRTAGGMPDLTGAVLQAAKWADGMGYVVRGGRFPYRQ